MKKTLLFALSLLLGCTVQMNAQLLSSQVEKKVLTNVCADDLVKVNRQTRNLQNKKQEPKWLTNLPMDSALYTMTMYPFSDDCAASYTTLFRTDLVEKFVGNKVDELTMYVHSGGYNLQFYIMDANDGEVLWNSDVYASYQGDGFITLPCDWVIDKVRNLQVGFMVEYNAKANAGKNLKIGMVPCFRDMNIIISSNSNDFSQPFYDYSTYPMMALRKNTYFGLPIYLITSGEGGLRDNGIEISGVSHNRVFVGENADVTASFINFGCMPIQSAVFESRLGSKVTTWEHNKPVPFLGSGSFDMIISTDEGAERRPLSVGLKSINGETPADEIVAIGSITTIDPERNVQRNVLMEEFTGTWCGWCPRGMVAIDMLTEEYKDMFIPIGVHFNDNMYDSSFDDVLGRYGGSFPSSVLNRLIVADPYLGSSNTTLGIDNDLQKIFALPTEVSVSLDKAALSEDGKKIALESSAKFFVKCDDSPYCFAYALTEDGIEGVQTNYFNTYASDYKNEPNLGWLTKEKLYWKTTFNHVGRRMFTADEVNGYLADGIKDGDSRTHSCEIAVPENVSDVTKLHAVVILFDAESGEIVNAASIPVAAETAIHGVQQSAANVEVLNGAVKVTAQQAQVTVYGMDGRVLKSFHVKGTDAIALPAGCYVVKVADGQQVTTQKVAL